MKRNAAFNVATMWPENNVFGCPHHKHDALATVAGLPQAEQTFTRRIEVFFPGKLAGQRGNRRNVPVRGNRTLSSCCSGFKTISSRRRRPFPQPFRSRRLRDDKAARGTEASLWPDLREVSRSRGLYGFCGRQPCQGPRNRGPSLSRWWGSCARPSKSATGG